MDRCLVLLLTILSSVARPAYPAEIPPIPQTDYDWLDTLAYSQQAAERTWRPMAGSENVTVVNIGGKKALRLGCNFRNTRIERASWDRPITLDLTMCKGVQFLCYCPDATPVSSFSFYFHSGAGWYSGHFDAPASSGWGRVEIHKDATRVEGKPAGWGKIDTIRISAWRGRNSDTEFYITALGLLGSGAEVVVARGDSAARSAPAEKKAATQFADTTARLLDRAGLEHVVVSDLDITASRLKATRLLILPHNPALPENIAGQIAKYLADGGKLIAFYTLPGRLQEAAAVRIGRHIRQRRPGQFASIRPSSSPLKGMPQRTAQASWNIMAATPVEGSSRVAAWWYDDKDQPTGQAAIILSSNCAYMTHVLLDDDPANKLQLLLAMIGNLDPQLWRRAAENRIHAIGRFGPYEDFGSAEQGIRRSAVNPEALATLRRAESLRDRARQLVASKDFSQAILLSQQARQLMIEAYCLAQKALPGEHRAFWCHSALGVAGMTWDQAIKTLAENGFTAILPNMLWGGVAFYESDVLPRSKTVAEKGDQVRLCLAACKKYRIQCHVWKVNFNMGWATEKTFIKAMVAQGRTQVNFDGSPNSRWLCPSHPANQKLEIDSMLEIARNYDVDGLHFDYIRYPGRQGCFCDGCRERFEKETGKRIANWPGDVRADPDIETKWNDFRRKQITTVVKAVSAGARKIKPDIEISAAVFRNWPSDRDSVAQDWKLWCDRGYLDFVCPMDYTASNSQFERMAAQQLNWAGRVRCYPGIGLSVWPDTTDTCRLIDQIKITRRLGTGGFTIFNYGPDQARNVLPMLGKGITRRAAEPSVHPR